MGPEINDSSMKRFPWLNNSDIPKIVGTFYLIANVFKFLLLNIPF